ncbi:MAG TPA: c-type cytochrome [Terracidiphilus sp.]|nr:c-type cytochrome [Terracidiphilus sp.]
MRLSAKLFHILLPLIIIGCKREQRVFDPGSTGATPAGATVLNEVSAGQPPTQKAPLAYQQSAYTVAEGKRLYEAYNCVGCHAQGGGAIGPALMDSVWIYGSSLEQIHSTIVQGRPNGMPSFAGKIPDYQVWEIAAYVRSMSGLLPSDVAPSRSDHMQASLPESARQKEHPEQENQQPVEGPKQ